MSNATVTFDQVTMRDIETLAQWAREQPRPASWGSVARRAQNGSIPALKRIAQLRSEHKGPWAE